MTWIKTDPPESAADDLQNAFQALKAMYPACYVSGDVLQRDADKVMASHALIPPALYHAFATYAVLLSEDLPLNRREHELIATAVSAANQCNY
ncbi:MAG: carboxymuconolactone decarboxylase family protein [Planctomycetota bacterium]|nr:carboxymuconolactone decarboxylase family protein [Planctomycetota bacterium]MDA1141365.1 carboxymuconolactone decarboxylase family protein [Planctomycetota bacterium]